MGGMYVMYNLFAFEKGFQYSNLLSLSASLNIQNIVTEQQIGA